MRACVFPVRLVNQACVIVRLDEQWAFNGGFVWSIITQMTMMTMSERLQIKEFDRKVVSFNQNFVYATISFNVKFKNDSMVVWNCLCL